MNQFKKFKNHNINKNELSKESTSVSILRKRLNVKELTVNDGRILAYLYNLRAGKGARQDTSEKMVLHSFIDLYFIDTKSHTIHAQLPFSPYMLLDVTSRFADFTIVDLDIKKSYLMNHIVNLSREIINGNVELCSVNKINLDEKGHLLKPSRNKPQEMTKLYSEKEYIKIIFDNVEDLVKFKGYLVGEIKKNKALYQKVNELKSQPTTDSEMLSGVSCDSFAYDIKLTESASSQDASWEQRINSLIQRNPLLMVSELYESDVAYAVRTQIDNSIRCGLWYYVHKSQSDKIELELAEEEIQKMYNPALKVLAFDIETSKSPLKFPNPNVDCVMCISYVHNGHGFLIVNREWFANDINDFEYSPTNEFHTEFKIYNCATEKEVLDFFLKHVIHLSPHILVTYNGDNFDFFFLDERCRLLGLSLYESIGLSQSSKLLVQDGGRITDHVYLGNLISHLDCFRWVERDSYLPCGSRGLKSVCKIKLKYHPKELDPELMVKVAKTDPQTLAEYSVSDAVATFYLYSKFIHSFIFALCTIVPLPSEHVLRKGAGSLCEHLLMAEAYTKGILIANKYIEQKEKYMDGSLLHSDTYVGGKLINFAVEFTEQIRQNTWT